MEDRVQLQQFDFNNIEGISLNQLQQHYQLYKGYVDRVNEIWEKLKGMDKSSAPNTTFSDIRSLKLGESYALDGVKLHVLYFQNIGGTSKIPHGLALDLIERDFGSYGRFLQRLSDVALSMRGWAVVAIDLLDNRLHIYGLDEHDKGAVWGAYPILVLDVYEHAYMIDFGIDRKRYIETFIKNINWSIVNSRINEYLKLRAIENNFLGSSIALKDAILLYEGNDYNRILDNKIVNGDVINCLCRCPLLFRGFY
ncbi:MAG: superoxide dismutase [Bacillota bacterium]|nr:superoxide dismutase [Bacillota bacterium]